MKVHVYLLNKTYIAEDSSTGLVAYGETIELAEKRLTDLVTEYWEKKKVIVPIQTDTNSVEIKDIKHGT